LIALKQHQTRKTNAFLAFAVQKYNKICIYENIFILLQAKNTLWQK